MEEKRYPILDEEESIGMCCEPAISRIDQFEEELANGQVKWISSKDAWAQLYSKYPWSRGYCSPH